MFRTCSYRLKMRSAEEINPIFNKLLALNTVGHSHTHAWLHFLSVIVTLVVIRPSVSRSRTLPRLTWWLTRGYELLKASLNHPWCVSWTPLRTCMIWYIVASHQFDLFVSSLCSSVWWVDGASSTGPLLRRQSLRTLGRLQWQVRNFTERLYGSHEVYNWKKF